MYQHTYVRDHVFSGGVRLDRGDIRSHSMGVEVDYGLTDALSIGGGMPYIAARYRGSAPHAHAGGRTQDDGRYHGGLQDLRLELRYGAIDSAVAVTPFVAVIVPADDYEYFAHSAIGVRLREAQLGASIGFVRPRFYLQGRYAYGVSQRVIGRRRNRSTVDAEAGFFLGPRVRVFAFELGQVTHGGLEIRPGLAGLTAQELPHHDRLGRANILDVGGGAAVAVAPSMDVVVSALRNVGGDNIHAAQYALTVGASWGFGRPSGAGHHAPASTR
ncbi:MAG TPA: hypothetical protein VFR81_28985 [Longimicrobium sp.]|nr:hypothetical protein [Longimicrobium sp.]